MYRNCPSSVYLPPCIFFLRKVMPSKPKPKVTLAQRLVGLQQIVLADVRSAQMQLLETINQGDLTALQSSMRIVERALKMRELVEQMLELVRAEKSAQPQSSQAKPAAPRPTTTAETKPPVTKSPPPKAPAKKKAPAKTTATARKAAPTKKATPAPTAAAPVPAAVPQQSEEAAVSPPHTATPPVETATTKRRGTAPTGVRTSEAAFVLPILHALIEKGGQAAASDVVESVLERMKGILTPGDFESTATTDQPRWKVSLYLARSMMVRKGLLRNDSPRGVWAISDAGRQYAESQQNQ